MIDPKPSPLLFDVAERPRPAPPSMLPPGRLDGDDGSGCAMPLAFVAMAFAAGAATKAVADFAELFNAWLLETLR